MTHLIKQLHLIRDQHLCKRHSKPFIVLKEIKEVKVKDKDKAIKDMIQLLKMPFHGYLKLEILVISQENLFIIRKKNNIRHRKCHKILIRLNNNGLLSSKEEEWIRMNHNLMTSFLGNNQIILSRHYKMQDHKKEIRQ